MRMYVLYMCIILVLVAMCQLKIDKESKRNAFSYMNDDSSNWTGDTLHFKGVAGFSVSSYCGGYPRVCVRQKNKRQPVIQEVCIFII